MPLKAILNKAGLAPSIARRLHSTTPCTRATVMPPGSVSTGIASSAWTCCGSAIIFLIELLSERVTTLPYKTDVRNVFGDFLVSMIASCHGA
jgi:hypothetical protein